MSDAPADKCLTPQAFWRALEHRGVSPAAVLKRAGLPATLDRNAEGYVTTAQLFAIWKAVEALTEDPAFGLKLLETGERAGRKPALMAACYAADYRSALHRFAGFKRFGTCFQLRFEERDGQFAIAKDWLFATEPEPALSADMSLGSLLELGRKGTGVHLTPLRVEFTRAGLQSEEHRLYFGCPIRYGAPRNLLVLRSSDVDRPFPGGNPELLELLAPALTEPPSEFQAGVSVCERVKAALKKRLAAGRPEVAEVARDLAMSERTLQRRIAEEGATYRGLLTEARRELGRGLLADPAMEADRVARQLGFESTSAFYRAFREWEGTTPGRWRATQGG